MYNIHLLLRQLLLLEILMLNTIPTLTLILILILTLPWTPNPIITLSLMLEISSQEQMLDHLTDYHYTKISHLYEPHCTNYRGPHDFVHFNPGLTLIRLGGGAIMAPPLDISRDYSATREALAATLYDNFLSSFPHILTPNLWRPGVRFRSYVTLCTCTSDRKWLQNVILCTKSMQIEFSHLVHINMHIFTLNCWN